MTYSPNFLFNQILDLTGTPNDNRLARRLGINKARISNIRNNKEAISARVLLSIHDLTGLPAKQLREMAGIEEDNRYYP